MVIEYVSVLLMSRRMIYVVKETLWEWYLFFFFKQKTAYEMRISDWSSDVCSSDLVRRREGEQLPVAIELGVPSGGQVAAKARLVERVGTLDRAVGQIGRASCRERVCQYV